MRTASSTTASCSCLSPKGRVGQCAGSARKKTDSDPFDCCSRRSKGGNQPPGMWTRWSGPGVGSARRANQRFVARQPWKAAVLRRSKSSRAELGKDGGLADSFFSAGREIAGVDRLAGHEILPGDQRIKTLPAAGCWQSYAACSPCSLRTAAQRRRPICSKAVAKTFIERRIPLDVQEPMSQPSWTSGRQPGMV